MPSTCIFDQPGVASYGIYGFNSALAKDIKYFRDCSRPWSERLTENTISLSNILGWIPIIGGVIGAIRIYAASQILKDNPTADDKAFAIGMIIRGVAEILCLGILLALVDAVVTVARTRLTS